MEQILVHGISPDELVKKIEALLDKKLESFSRGRVDNQDQLITRKETAQLLKISLPTLHEWTKEGWLKSYRIGTRVLYKLQEVKSSLTEVGQRKFKKTAF